MKAILLLAGASNRFWPLQEKPLFSLLGKTLFEKQVATLTAAGITTITVVCSNKNKAALQVLQPNLQFVVQAPTKTGMWGGVLSALKEATQEPILIFGNDNCKTDVLKNVITATKAGKGVLVAKEVQTYFPGGYIALQNNKVESIIEKPGAGNEPSNLVNLVIHGHPSALALKEALLHTGNTQDDGYEQALNILFKTHTYLTEPYQGEWIPIKYPWHVLSALEHELATITTSQIDPSVQIHNSAVITGNVHIGHNTKILPHATIVGPCFIGNDCIVGNNALVRQASLGNKCVIGFNSEVKHSVLANQVETHSTYIGDSIIGENVSFGAGSVTGNLRLDEAEIYSTVKGQPVATGYNKLGAIVGNNCRFGIHTSINPGVKIGSNTFVASASLLETDIPANSFVRTKNGILTIKPNTSNCPTMETREGFKEKL